MTSLPPRILIQDLQQRFERRTVIDHIDLAIDAGEFLVILGPSGCGKSTLLRLVAGLLSPTQGSLHRDPSEGGIGFVFQDASLLPWRTALENVRLPLELDGHSLADAQHEAHALLEAVGLGAFHAHYPDALSGGMRMRVSIARALAGHPRLLLLDEPFAALDEVTRQRLDRHLSQLVKLRGITTLFVTHSITEAVSLADRIIVMAPPDGRIVFDTRVDHAEDNAETFLESPGNRALRETLSNVMMTLEAIA
jgi:NitT/TauT family transport system ATP-binding protein